MAGAKCLVFVFSLVFLFQNVYTVAIDSDDNTLLDILLERIESLEKSDAANKAKIAELELKFDNKQTENEREISNLEAESKLKEEMMLKEIDELKAALVESKGESENKNRRTMVLQTDNRQNQNIKRRESNIRKYREFPETEIAFYATHSEHDIHHLGNNQILQFQQVITNIGSAYNNDTGAFVPPVDGTYVIHATVMGLDIHVNNHMHAFFVVDGIVYSKFWVTIGDQSSQMLVIDLKAGQTVTMRNDYQDDGFVGQHYSTFSGFLLYEHAPSSVAVGK